MKKLILQTTALLLAASLLFSACSSHSYSFNGKKTKHCGCAQHKGMIG